MVSQPLARLSVFSLVMLITVSIDSIRNLPIAALFGPQMIFFFLVAGLTFLIPTGLVAAELTASYTEHSGIYGWVKQAFGSNTGFFAIWLQWINTLVWYPTTLAFIAGSIAYSIDPQLAKDKYLLTMIIVVVFWLLTLVNLRGLQTSTRFASICAVFGMIIPMAAIIVLALAWVLMGHHSVVNFSHHHWVPKLTTMNSWVSMTAIVTSFLGMELVSVHVKGVDKAEKRLPLAIVISGVVILVTMLAGSLAVAMVIPAGQIDLVDGVMQEFHALLGAFHLLWLQPVLAILMIMGGLGSMINWMISPAQGLLQASQDGYLPPCFARQNQAGVAYWILLLQATVVSLVSAAFFLMPSINASYWLLTALSTELYVAMYVLMFLAALALYIKQQRVSRMLRLLGGKWLLFVLCGLGLVGSAITLVVGFVPPTAVDTGASGHFREVFIIGLVLMILPCLLGFGYRRRCAAAK